MNFNEIIRKNVTYDDIKKDTKTNLCTLFEGSLKYILRLRLGSFLNGTSILVFAKLAIFHSI